MIVLSQKWPITYCKYWMQQRRANRCVFPTAFGRWTLHGIWPWRKKDDTFPEYCDKSWKFDENQIRDIKPELKQAWMNIFEGTMPNSLWEHEWNRHGTCASVMEPFSTQFRYFKKGVEWNLKYWVKGMLEDAQVFPSDVKKYSPHAFVRAVEGRTGKQPFIVCQKLKNGVSYIKEIRLCFDTHYIFIDCNTVIDDTSCDEDVIYPATV
ncbi:ribonuclease Oy-like [Spodoptera frugiperda]|uniref:Ribonuclease Oy-like n=1 Tax=Spodoptera frugiperda TaxID=7108 RepID=A0A9R0CYG0_SPOFR|nr:ribonuclease Oy-like [Spodoptera frugiperda]